VLKISGVHVSPYSAETLVRRGGITNHRSIAQSLGNISAKNYRNWLMCVEVTVCNISIVFWDTCLTKHKPNAGRRKGLKCHFLSLMSLTFDLYLHTRSSEEPSTSSVWIWRKSVHRFPRYFILKKVTDSTKTEFCLLTYSRFTSTAWWIRFGLAAQAVLLTGYVAALFCMQITFCY